MWSKRGEWYAPPPPVAYPHFLKSKNALPAILQFSKQGSIVFAFLLTIAY